jgi:hypothetical protein
MRFTPTQHGGLLPFDLPAREFMRNLTSAEPIELEVLHPRDMVFLARIFATIAEVARGLGRDPERIRAELLYLTGNFQLLGEMYGKVVVAVTHMDRRHMRDHELHAFWDDAVDVIRQEMLPQIKDPDARSRLEQTLLPGGVEQHAG